MIEEEAEEATIWLDEAEVIIVWLVDTEVAELVTGFVVAEDKEVVEVAGLVTAAEVAWVLLVCADVAATVAGAVGEVLVVEGTV